MANDKINGSEYGLFIDVTGGTTYDTVVCLTEHSFKVATAILDANSYCGPDKRPGVTSFECDFSGYVILTPGALKTSIAELYAAAAAKTTVGWAIKRLATAISGDVNWVGTGFIANFDTSFTTEDAAKFSSSLGIYGTPTFTITP